MMKDKYLNYVLSNRNAKKYTNVVTMRFTDEQSMLLKKICDNTALTKPTHVIRFLLHELIINPSLANEVFDDEISQVLQGSTNE